ncbi:NADP oxidoreductase [Streptomyces sp. NPDC005811]|uniref:NADPH-dependent F420 reductase n=1 Tax=Streptomyces sp. NPDC005811 TaxID=3154565 RepID=UPI0034076D81
MLSIPLARCRQLPAAALAGKVVLDTMNYAPFRDGTFEDLDSGRITTGELVQEHLVGAKLVKAFSGINDQHAPALARPEGAADRSALPIAGHDEEAKASAAALVSRLGFDTVDAGPLAESWRFDPETGPFVAPYFTEPDTLRAVWAKLGKEIRSGGPIRTAPLVDPGVPLPAHRLRTLLAETPRKLTADRLV